MSKCTNTDIGSLLHGYEIGILSDEECEHFEAHLLQCEHCHNLLTSFEQTASLLVSSKRARAAIDKGLSEKTCVKSYVSKIWKYLWPNAPLVFRPAIAYFVILLLITPAYQGLKRPGESAVTEFKQKIHLSPTRAAAKVLKKATSDNGLLTFEFDGYRPGAVYRVVVESEDGTVIYTNSHFSSFDEREIGSLNLAISHMTQGRYRLIVSDPRSDSALVSCEYLFLIEE